MHRYHVVQRKGPASPTTHYISELVFSNEFPKGKNHRRKMEYVNVSPIFIHYLKYNSN